MMLELVMLTSVILHRPVVVRRRTMALLRRPLSGREPKLDV